MAQTTFVNKRGIVHTKSGGQSAAFPDVCLTKVGKSIEPIAYTNTGHSRDTSQGPVSVTTDGQMPMVKDALYSRSAKPAMKPESMEESTAAPIWVPASF
jgi:hypothetical protein